MNDTTAWWLLAGALVAVELLSGSFYLLMLAFGAAVGALCAHFGWSANLQIFGAAATGALATLACYRLRKTRKSGAADVEADWNANLDIGQIVQVEQWDALGQCQVLYRGASWHARHLGEGPPMPGPHRIAALRGNTLELTPF